MVEHHAASRWEGSHAGCAPCDALAGVDEGAERLDATAWWGCADAPSRASRYDGRLVRVWHGLSGCAGCIGGTRPHEGREGLAPGDYGGRVADSGPAGAPDRTGERAGWAAARWAEARTARGVVPGVAPAAVRCARGEVEGAAAAAAAVAAGSGAPRWAGDRSGRAGGGEGGAEGDGEQHDSQTAARRGDASSPT